MCFCPSNSPVAAFVRCRIRIDWTGVPPLDGDWTLAPPPKYNSIVRFCSACFFLDNFCSLLLIFWSAGVTVSVSFRTCAGVMVISLFLQAQSFPVVDINFSDSISAYFVVSLSSAMVSLATVSVCDGICSHSGCPLLKNTPKASKHGLWVSCSSFPLKDLSPSRKAYYCGPCM